jgi:hypothetical protein
MDIVKVREIANRTGKSNLLLVRHLTDLGVTGNVALKLVIELNIERRNNG